MTLLVYFFVKYCCSYSSYHTILYRSSKWNINGQFQLLHKLSCRNPDHQIHSYCHRQDKVISGRLHIYLFWSNIGISSLWCCFLCNTFRDRVKQSSLKWKVYLDYTLTNEDRCICLKPFCNIKINKLLRSDSNDKILWNDIVYFNIQIISLSLSIYMYVIPFPI